MNVHIHMKMIRSIKNQAVESKPGDGCKIRSPGYDDSRNDRALDLVLRPCSRRIGNDGGAPTAAGR